MFFDHLALAALTSTATATDVRAQWSRRAPNAPAAPEVVRRRKKVSTESRVRAPKKAAARADVPPLEPLEPFEIVAPDADFVHALQPDDFPLVGLDDRR